jgi:hypothetical protein
LVSGNAATGVYMSSGSGEFHVANCFIVKNYLGISAPSPGASTLEFSTLADNQTGGVSCGSVNSASFANDIVSPTNASCSWVYSDVYTSGSTVSGAGNVNVDPVYANEAAGDFHITTSSPCVDAADPNATETVDYDGDARPLGAGYDMGADEVR